MSPLHEALAQAHTLEGLARLRRLSGWRLFPRARARLSVDGDDPYSVVQSFASGVLLELRPVLDYLSEDDLRGVVRRIFDMSAQMAMGLTSRGYEVLTETFEHPDDGEEAERIVRTIAAREKLARMRAAATPGQRRVVDMALRLGTTNESELSEALGIAPGTLASHLHRFRALGPST